MELRPPSFGFQNHITLPTAPGVSWFHVVAVFTRDASSAYCLVPSTHSLPPVPGVSGSGTGQELIQGRGEQRRCCSSPMLAVKLEVAVTCPAKIKRKMTAS